VLGDADEAARGVARQLRVGVERDDVTDVGEQSGVGRRDDETRIARAAQQAVELLQLAALALPAHPLPLARVPQPLAVEKVEALERGRVGPVTRVQLLYAGRRLIEQRRVRPHLGHVRVREIAEQGEVQVLVLVGEVVDFQLLKQLFDRRIIGEERRDDDHRAGVRGHALFGLHARQKARVEQVRHVPVEHAQRQIAGRDE
jgi:hypothetical protein